MSKKTLVFGNGLGMAVDPGFYSLSRAIRVAWSTSSQLSESSKNLIRLCLPESAHERPESEADLDTLQLALSACEFLSGIKGSRLHWLSEQGQLFPRAVRSFIYETAIQFHGHSEGLPVDFIESLVAFIQLTKSHVATLNYDNLLYAPFVGHQVLRGYYGDLVDGFWGRSGFAPNNLERYPGRNFGYYMHLHGSPLYVDRPGGTFKLAQSDVFRERGVVSSHVVLTHIRHKRTVISGSRVLAAYWDKFQEALVESEEVLLFGCSGDDEHLNDVIRNAPRSLRLRVVEWNGFDSDEQRNIFWRRVLRDDVELVRLESILSFRDW